MGDVTPLPPLWSPLRVVWEVALEGPLAWLGSKRQTSHIYKKQTLCEEGKESVCPVTSSVVPDPPAGVRQSLNSHHVSANLQHDNDP